MPNKIPSVGDLRRKSEVSDEEIEDATAAYLKDDGAPPFAIKSGHREAVRQKAMKKPATANRAG
ncbi:MULTISPECIES: hypothetical protein [unclassified Methylobacterium]|uniref:hypothetical protein n=1 Tax=unclassified Methylobacterium TaxID=2615210 RepID=UPI00226A98DE|nr:MULTISPECIES: hypothetical protein [unclassified Methylobacterium]